MCNINIAAPGRRTLPQGRASEKRPRIAVASFHRVNMPVVSSDQQSTISMFRLTSKMYEA
jgi:hypothetical protein